MAITFVLGSYLIMMAYYFGKEKGLLMEAYSTYRKEYQWAFTFSSFELETELKLIFAIMFVLTIGVLDGFKKAIFSLFLYHVPGQMLL